MERGTRFLRFAVIGGAAFLVDAGLLYLLIWSGMGPYLGRVISLLTAATCTWLGNRKFTFDTRPKPAAKEVGTTTMRSRFLNHSYLLP